MIIYVLVLVVCVVGGTIGPSPGGGCGRCGEVVFLPLGFLIRF